MYPELKVFQRNISRSSEIIMALRASNERLQAAMETGRMGVWELDLKSGLLYWYLGFSPVGSKSVIRFEGPYEDYLDTVFPDDRKGMTKAVQSFLGGTKKKFHQEFRVCSTDGEVHWVESKGSSSGGVGVGIWMDITRQKLNLQRTETQKDLSLLLIQNVSLVEAAPKILKIIVKGLDWDKAVFLENNVVLAVYPKNSGEAGNTGTKGTEFTLPILFHTEVIAEIRLWSQYTKILTREGKKIYQVIASQIAQFIQRTRARAEFAESKAQLETILQNVSEGIVVQDFRGEIIYANQAAAILMDFPDIETMAQTSAADFFARFKFFNWQGDRVNLSDLPGRKALLEAKENSLVVRRQNIKTGAEKWLLIKSRPIKDSKNSVRMSITILEDITEQIASQNQRDLFLGVASHELKTPIMSIKAFGQLARRKHNPVYLDKIDEQANRLTRIINEILDVNRIRAGQFEFRKKEADLIFLIRKSISNIKPIFSNHRIEMNLAPKAPVHADPERLSQAISNLVINAIKYSPEADRVIVCAKIAKGEVIFSVRDFGIGISRKNLRYLFESYYRIRSAHINMIDGLGLGLYITASIVKAHQGKIWVKSQEGKGSTFFFSLPLSRH